MSLLVECVRSVVDHSMHNFSASRNCRPRLDRHLMILANSITRSDLDNFDYTKLSYYVSTKIYMLI
jgi:hypothetical protein